MSPRSAAGRVDKVVQIVAVSSESWEVAAQNAVAEAAKSIRDLSVARVLEHDLTVSNGAPKYRIKLEVAFQVDRTRTDARGQSVEIRRYLVLANRTLVNQGLLDFVAQADAAGEAEFHIVVPETGPLVLHTDPSTGLISPDAHTVVTETRNAAREEGERRLATFRTALGELGHRVTGEVVIADPTTAVRAVMARGSFDEVVVSTLPAGVSKWLRLDVPSRVQRACKLPVTTIVADDAS